MNKPLVCLLALTGSLLTTVATAAVEKRVVREYEVGETGQFKIGLPGADLSVVAGQAGQILVDIRLIANTDDKAKAEEAFAKAEIHDEASRRKVALDIQGKPRGLLWQSRQWPDDLELRVTAVIPANFEVEVDGTSGSIQITGLRERTFIDSTSAEITVVDCHGPVTVDSTSGSITLVSVQGSMLIDNTSGRVVAENTEGPLTIDCTSADVTVTGHRGALSVDGTSGDVRALLAPSPEPVDIDLSSGSVSLIFPEAEGADLNLETNSGVIAVSQALSEVQTRTSDDLVGRIGIGGRPVTVSTSSGSIRID